MNGICSKILVLQSATSILLFGLEVNVMDSEIFDWLKLHVFKCIFFHNTLYWKMTLDNGLRTSCNLVINVNDLRNYV